MCTLCQMEIGNDIFDTGVRFFHPAVAFLLQIPLICHLSTFDSALYTYLGQKSHYNIIPTDEMCCVLGINKDPTCYDGIKEKILLDYVGTTSFLKFALMNEIRYRVGGNEFCVAKDSF